jgi:hypothetical protein
VKCIIFTGIPLRVPNEDAHKLVDVQHRATYCGKKLWKKQHDDAKEKRVRSYLDQDGRIGTLTSA